MGTIASVYQWKCKNCNILNPVENVICVKCKIKKEDNSMKNKLAEVWIVLYVRVLLVCVLFIVKHLFLYCTYSTLILLLLLPNYFSVFYTYVSIP